MSEFAEALTLAVEASGLSLDRIQHHLESRGVPVSQSTLSCWRRGRSRPERPESLAAVAALEEILQVSPGALTGRLGDRRPRGRWVERATALEGIWGDAAIDLGREIARVDRLLPAPARYLSVRDRVLIGPDRREVEIRSSAVIEAFEDGVDRMLLAKTADGTDLSPGGHPRPRAARRRDRPGGPAADLRPRRRQLLGGPRVRPHAAQLRAGGRVPPRRRSRALPQLQPTGPDAPEAETGELWIGTTAAAHLLVHEAQAGHVHGIRWEWE